MPPNYQEPADKPYDFVVFPSEAPDTEGTAGQKRLEEDRLSGWLELTLETLRPLQVAHGFVDFQKAGNQEHLTALQASVQRRQQGGIGRQYVIPGSSIKGSVRSILEAVSRSCVPVRSSQTRPSIPSNLNRCNDPKSLCPACRLFGAQNYQGQLSFEDALIPPGNLVLVSLPLLWTPARGGRGLPRSYLRGNTAKGRKFYYHSKIASGQDNRTAVKTGATIDTRVHFINLKTGEMGLLITALGLNPDYLFPIKVGAAKPVGMGSVQVHLNAIQFIEGVKGVRAAGRLGGQAGTENRLEGERLEEEIKAWVKGAMESQLVIQEQLKDLAEILDENGLEDEALSGMY